MASQGSSHPTVYVVVLNWNNFEDTHRCLQSLLQATYPALKIIVVDNGSADQSGQRLQLEFPQLRFVLNDSNRGFSRGCNVGIKAALDDKECEYVLLLNNDAYVPADFLQEAVRTAESDKLIGLVGGKILYSPESRKIWYAGGHVDRWRGRAVVRGFREMDQGQYDTPGEVGYVTGALMLIKREVLERVGLLPEEYFFGLEEYDFSLTVKAAGFKLCYVPQFESYHSADGSHSNYDPKYVYNNYRSKLIFQEKFLPKGIFPLWKLIFILYGKYSAKRVWEKLRQEDDGLEDNSIPFGDLDFAFSRAIADHGTELLTEASLDRFQKLLNSRRNGANNKTSSTNAH